MLAKKRITNIYVIKIIHKPLNKGQIGLKGASQAKPDLTASKPFSGCLNTL